MEIGDAIEIREAEKPSLYEAINAAEIEHQRCCPGPGLLRIGSYPDYFDDIYEQPGRLPYWIQDNTVFLTVKCPDYPHECLSTAIEYSLLCSLEAFSGIEFLGTRSTRVRLFNELGCHSIIGKEPDFSFALDRRYSAGEVSPVIIGEIGSNHEDLHLLFCEASAWLGRSSKVVYVILAKIWPSESGNILKIFLLTKNPTGRTSIESNVSGRNPRFCISAFMDFPNDRHLSKFQKEHVEEYYQVRILEEICLNGIVPGEGASFKLDLHPLLQGTILDLAKIPQVCIVDLTTRLNQFFRIYKE